MPELGSAAGYVLGLLLILFAFWWLGCAIDREFEIMTTTEAVERLQSLRRWSSAFDRCGHMTKAIDLAIAALKEKEGKKDGRA